MKFTATKRKAFGSSASRRLRRAGRVPAIVYGGEGEPLSIELDHNEIFHALRKEAFHSSILTMDLDGETEEVYLRATQWHAYKPQVLHVDFQRIVRGVLMQFKVPLHFEGGDESPAVKEEDAVISQVLNEVEIECMPRHLPQSIVVDLSQMHDGDSITVEQLALPEGVTVLLEPEETVAVASRISEEDLDLEPEEDEEAAEGEEGEASDEDSEEESSDEDKE